MKEPLDWNGIRDFVATIEAGSLTRAATKLRISQPTLSRRITALESRLGAQLLVRGPRHFSVTDAGKQLLLIARQMETSSSRIVDGDWNSNDPLQGVVRVSATEGFVDAWLIKQLAGFSEIHPRIQVEVLSENALTDLVDRNADIAIRLLRPTQKDLVTKKVGILKLGYYASSSYIEKNHYPSTLSDLAGHKTIAIIGSRKFASDVESITNRGRIVLRVRNVSGVLSAISFGIGIGPLYCFKAAQHTNLKQVLAEEPTMNMEIWLTAHPEIHETSRIRLLYDFLSARFADQKEVFS
jgi:DNA-binding transcriptional LysR family regulator